MIKRLAEMAKVPVVWHYNVTTIDPPELVHFIKRVHPDVIRIPPRHGNFFKRAEHKGFPSVLNRWCCAEYKEGQTPSDVTMLMGIRSQESSKRSQRWGNINAHFRTNALVVNPSFQWDDSEVWEFIRDERLPYCSLYDEGFKRLGCVGCPQSDLKKAFLRWPKYRDKWHRLFQRLWAKRSGTRWRGKRWFGDTYFKDADAMFHWWAYERTLPEPIKETDGPA